MVLGPGVMAPGPSWPLPARRCGLDRPRKNRRGLTGPAASVAVAPLLLRGVIARNFSGVNAGAERGNPSRQKRNFSGVNAGAERPRRWAVRPGRNGISAG